MGRPDREPSALWAAFTNENRFGLFVTTSGLSNLGTWCQNLAAVMLIHQLTGDTFFVALVSIAQYSSSVVISPWAGMLADRYNRIVILLITQWAGVLISLGLAWAVLTGVATVWAVLIGVFMLGVSQAFQYPTQMSLIPFMAAPSQRDVIISINSSQFNLARAFGPMLAALIIAVWGVGIAFLVNAISYSAYLVALHLIRPVPQQRGGGQISFLGTLRVIRETPIVMVVLFAGFVLTGATEVFTTLAPETSLRLTGGDAFTGAFLTAFGLGAAGGVFLTTYMRRFKSQLPTLMTILALGVVVYVVAGTLWVALAGAAVSGVAFLLASNRGLVILQSSVPQYVLGSVTAYWVVGVLAGRVVFAGVAGLIAPPFGTVAAGIAVAVIVVLSALLTHWGTRRVRAMAR